MPQMLEGMEQQACDEPMVTVRVEVREAQAVYVMGPFNNWSTTATPMRQVDAGAWETVVPTRHTTGRLSFFVWPPGQRRGHVLCSAGRRECEAIALEA